MDPHAALRWAAILAILVFPACCLAAGPALECHGVKSDNPAIRYELTVTGLEANNVLIVDGSTNEKCSCEFRHSGFFDQSAGKVPGYIVSVDYQSCDNACPERLKRLTSANIRVTHRRRETYSTPFVGRQISSCDRFSIDVPALRKIEGQRIDSMDQPEDFKLKLKSFKGIED